MTKRNGFPLRAGGHDVADFHLAVADDDPINEQCDQLSTLGKHQMVERRADVVAKGLDAQGQVRMLTKVNRDSHESEHPRFQRH